MEIIVYPAPIVQEARFAAALTREMVKTVEFEPAVLFAVVLTRRVDQRVTMYEMGESS